MSVEVTRLPSGLVVVTDAMPHLETASLGVWVGCGSRDEREDEHGIAHLLEHMAFKGTTRRTAQEIAAAEDTPDDIVFDYLQATAFPAQSVGRSILGTPASVRSFDAARLRAYLARNYRGPDMVVAAAGAIDHRAVVAEVERRFSAFNGSAAPLPDPAKFGGGIRVEARDLEQVHIALALEGVP